MTQFDNIDGVVSSSLKSPGIVEVAHKGSGKHFHDYCRKKDLQYEEVKQFAGLTLVLVHE